MSHETDRLRGIFDLMPGYTSWMKKVVSINAFSDCETAQYRLRVIRYYQQFGMHATLAAFPVKRSTVFLWQSTLKKQHGRLASLIPHSSRPHHCREMHTHPLVLSYIARLRRQHYRLGKEKIHPLLHRYCLEQGLACPAQSTIGKIITRHHLFFSPGRTGLHDPDSKRPERAKRIRVKAAPKPTAGGYVELDTIETRSAGVVRYTMTAIDVKLKIAYARTFTGKHAANARLVLETFASMLPLPVRIVQTDNGSEFLDVFDQYCQTSKLTHVFTYPHSPKINGVVERFNRTIREDCLEVYYDEIDDVTKINRRLADYLCFYHNDRIHAALGNKTPAEVIGTYIKSPKGV